MPEIFVFGSNLAGRHGKGSAQAALKQHGAIYGQGWGQQGLSYAIPTKDHDLKVLPLEEIKRYVNRFLDYARASPDLTFNIVAIGTGEAGYKPEEIAPMFEGCPTNCNLPPQFKKVLQPKSTKSK